MDLEEAKDKEKSDTRSEWQRHIGVGEKCNIMATVSGGYNDSHRKGT